MSLRMGSRFFCSNCAYDCETEADALAHAEKSEHTSFVDMDRRNFDETEDNKVKQKVESSKNLLDFMNAKNN